MIKKDYTNRHDYLGWLFYDSELKRTIKELIDKDNEISNIEKIFDIYACFSFGHHGKPPIVGNALYRFAFLDNDKEAICDFATELIKIYFINQEELKILSSYEKKEQKKIISLFKKTSWELAALCVLSDWIASGDDFKYYSNEIPLNEYLNIAEEEAIIAIAKTGILSSKPSALCGLSHMFPEYKHTATPLQRYCDEMILSDKPQLWILEDVTGAGKTEAALTLASRIISSGLAEGIFVALPTMATSNAMYERMAGVYYHLFDDNEKPSLVLSHGSRHLSDKFRQSYRDHIISENNADQLHDENIEEGKVHCARWLTDSSKKSLLADAGVGTVDQLLLGVLPVRYQSLRYYGMCRKVIIIDEVHSYDPYMLRILETVLLGHASSGGSVILLSATLPYKIRQRLVQAYREGLNEECESTELQERVTR
jgi:CRISPR-associated endonuclease/helicase Cas3